MRSATLFAAIAIAAIAAATATVVGCVGPEGESAESANRDTASLVACEAAVASIEAGAEAGPVRPEPNPQPTPDGDATRGAGQAGAVVGFTRPSDIIRDAAERTKAAIESGVMDLAHSAKVDVQVTFPENVKASGPATPARCCPTGNDTATSCSSPQPTRSTASGNSTEVASDPFAQYRAAREEHLKTGKPLAVLIGSASCGLCLQAKAMLPGVKSPAAYVSLDTDTEKQFVKAILACVEPRPTIRTVPVLVIIDTAGGNRFIDSAGVFSWIEEHGR